MAQPPLPVPNPLLLAVMLHCGGMPLAMPLPVAGIAGAPLARAIPTYLAIYRVGGELRFVVIGAPSSLAIGRAAYLLAGLELRWLEALLAIAATPFIHRGVVAQRVTANRPAGL